MFSRSLLQYLAVCRVGKKGLIKKDELLTMMGEDGGSDFGSDDDDEDSDDEGFSDEYGDDAALSGVPLPPMNMEQFQAMLHQMCAHHPQNPFQRQL